jgi:flagellar protein FlaJ
VSQRKADGSPEGFAEKGAELIITVVDYLSRTRARMDSHINRPSFLVGPYGFVRMYFKSRSERYSGLRMYLNQARISVPYDVYLTRAFYYSVGSALIGAVTGLMLTYVLWASGTLHSLTSPVSFSGFVASFAETYSTSIQGTLLTVSLALTFGLSIWAYFYYYPRLKADQRRRNINVMLPHGIVFMYALKYGGLSIMDAMRELSKSDDVYEEVAREFDMLVRDMDEFGTPLPIALRNARNLTPSESMRRFFDDLLSTIDSGGNTTKFLYNEGERYYEEAKDEQESFIQSLGILGEIYTTLFIAAPLLLIIILLVMSFIGAETLTAIAVVTYVGIPLGIISFGLLLHTTSKPYSWEQAKTLEKRWDEEEEKKDLSENVRNDPRYRVYRRTKVLKSVGAFVENPLNYVHRRPALSLLVSVPAALVALMVLSGSEAYSFSNLSTEPVRTTTVLVVVPVLVAVAPLSVFHEAEKARIRKTVSRFPMKLNAIANANDMGMSLRDSFEHVSKRGSAEINEEFMRVSNDISWKSDTSQALVDCANRLRIPQISRSMNLISEASKTTGDLNRILEVAARDTSKEYRMKKLRAQEMSGYIAVIVISFLVYLSVILMLDRFYLVPLYEAIPAPDPGAPSTDIGSLTEVPIETYRTLFFHSSLILAFGNGLLAGKMGENDLIAGLKYGIGFSLVTVAAFWVIT